VYESQVVVEAVYSKDNMIWSRPSTSNLNSRRKLMADNQKIRIVFSMVKKTGGVSVQEMAEVFKKQLRSPSSPLMVQPIFYGSVVHKCVEVDPVAHEPVTKTAGISSVNDIAEESSAICAAPVLIALLSMLAMM